MEQMQTFISVLPTLIVAILGIYITYVLSKTSNKIAHDNLSKQLFTEFNARYESINNILINIPGDSPLQIVLQDAANANCLVDYINLCAEEHYWYRQGRIDDRIWKSWHAGMKEWHQKLLALREMWEIESEFPESYYLLPGEDFFI